MNTLTKREEIEILKQRLEVALKRIEALERCVLPAASKPEADKQVVGRPEWEAWARIHAERNGKLINEAKAQAEFKKAEYKLDGMLEAERLRTSGLMGIYQGNERA